MVWHSSTLQSKRMFLPTASSSLRVCPSDVQDQHSKIATFDPSSVFAPNTSRGNAPHACAYGPALKLWQKSTANRSGLDPIYRISSSFCTVLWATFHVSRLKPYVANDDFLFVYPICSSSIDGILLSSVTAHKLLFDSSLSTF